jgi:hypothetical protein
VELTAMRYLNVEDFFNADYSELYIVFNLFFRIFPVYLLCRIPADVAESYEESNSFSSKNVEDFFDTDCTEHFYPISICAIPKLLEANNVSSANLSAPSFRIWRTVPKIISIFVFKI